VTKGKVPVKGNGSPFRLGLLLLARSKTRKNKRMKSVVKVSDAKQGNEPRISHADMITVFVRDESFRNGHAENPNQCRGREKTSKTVAGLATDGPTSSPETFVKTQKKTNKNERQEMSWAYRNGWKANWAPQGIISRGKTMDHLNAGHIGGKTDHAGSEASAEGDGRSDLCSRKASAERYYFPKRKKRFRQPSTKEKVACFRAGRIMTKGTKEQAPGKQFATGGGVYGVRK